MQIVPEMFSTPTMTLVCARIAQAWKGESWDNVEILTGKIMEPTKGKKKQFYSENVCTR